MDATMAIILVGVLLFVVVAGPLFGADSRPAWRNVDRKPRFRMAGSLRPEDWPPSEFKRSSLEPRKPVAWMSAVTAPAPEQSTGGPPTPRQHARVAAASSRGYGR
jgi:hypothetical protein